MNDYIYKDKVDYSILEKIKERFFIPSKGVIGINTSGMNKIIDGRLHLGTWAGPSADLFNVLHEMAHFIEIDSRRCHKPDWGLKEGKWVTIAGQYIRDCMYTNKAIEREIRTFAIQLHLLNEYAISGRNDYNEFSNSEEEIPHIVYMGRLCRHMDAFYLYKSKDESLSYDENEKFASNVISQRILELANDWNIQKIQDAWFKKVKILSKKGILQ